MTDKRSKLPEAPLRLADRSFDDFRNECQKAVKGESVNLPKDIVRELKEKFVDEIGYRDLYCSMLGDEISHEVEKLGLCEP